MGLDCFDYGTIIYWYLIPIIVLFIHTSLMKKGWNKSKSNFKITNIISLVIILILSIFSFLNPLITSDCVALAFSGVILLMIVFPIFGIVLFGWLIRCIAMKFKK
jgi:hypothetical protein